MPEVGVLVMAYGTPATPDEVEAYYTHIRRGRPPTPELLADLVSRYEAIGGISPLRERTEAQRLAIARALDQCSPGTFVTALGQKHATPFIEDAVAELARDGCSSIVGLVLAPHYSASSVGSYHERARNAVGADARYTGIESWYHLDAFQAFLADAIGEARALLPDAHKVLFTAHSLPERALVDDPYPDQLRESAEAIAGRAGLSPWYEWAPCWQSAGRTGEAWRGPDLLDVIRDLGTTGRSDGVLICPHGFVADHLEVLYDIDIAAREVASACGLQLARTRSINDDVAVMGALAQLVASAAEG